MWPEDYERYLKDGAARIAELNRLMASQRGREGARRKANRRGSKKRERLDKVAAAMRAKYLSRGKGCKTRLRAIRKRGTAI